MNFENMKKTRIGFFADGKWAHNAFKMLNNDRLIDIKFVCVRYDSNDEILKELANINDIDYLKHPNINSIDFLNNIKNYNCDLFISMSFNQIFKSKILSMPKMGIINCHAGKLPYYRGRNILNWVLINDEKEFGITAHYVDLGIDTGDIILQKTYPITDQDNYASLLKIAYVECANILYEAVGLVINGRAKPLVQTNIHPVGFYCGIRKEGDEVINWNQTSRELFNFVRAICKPGPQARTKHHDKTIKINEVKLIEHSIEYKGIPGQIIGKIEGMPIVKTLDSSIIISDYEYEHSLKVGDRLI